MTTRIAATIDLTVGMFEDEYDLTKVRTKPASAEAAAAIIAADPASMDGRSNWLWFTLPNGDVIFGCLPEGDTYEVWAAEAFQHV